MIEGLSSSVDDPHFGPTAPLGAEPEPPPRITLVAPKRFAPGAVLQERYRVVRLHASGGMGDVYEVEDLALGGRVALKALRAEIGRDPRALERFKREILRGLGNKRRLSDFLSHAGFRAEDGGLPGARRRAGEAITPARDVGSRQLYVFGLETLGRVLPETALVDEGAAGRMARLHALRALALLDRGAPAAAELARARAAPATRDERLLLALVEARTLDPARRKELLEATADEARSLGATQRMLEARLALGLPVAAEARERGFGLIARRARPR